MSMDNTDRQPLRRDYTDGRVYDVGSLYPQELEVVDLTPNVVVKNPTVRVVAGIVLGAVGLILGTAVVVDASLPEVDITAWTDPIMAGYIYLSSAFGLAVTVPNVPVKR